MEKLFNSVHFGKKVRGALIDRKLTHKQAAIEIGIYKSALDRVLYGMSPPIETYLRILQWLMPLKEFNAMYDKWLK